MAKIKTVFRCEAAGRDNNEDNGKILQLEKNGTLLIVCDGMGGMQAGEVASALAIATFEQWFAPENITEQALADPQAYMKQAIVGADTNIKKYSKTHPETEGMGSTVVMAWLLDQKVYVAWCGDSRAYRYNPQLGLERLSHDHSLVQTWVDAGQITEDQAFDHPQSNIITRSLGDPNGAALPDVEEFTLYNDDVLLLCSDGLCGTLRDREIEAIMANHADVPKCCDALWKADEEAGWHDNVTTAMAKVEAEGAVLSFAKAEQTAAPEMEIMDEPQEEEEQPMTRAKYLKYVGVVLLGFAIALGVYYFLKSGHGKDAEAPANSVENQVNKVEEKVGIEDTDADIDKMIQENLEQDLKDKAETEEKKLGDIKKPDVKEEDADKPDKEEENKPEEPEQKDEADDPEDNSSEQTSKLGKITKPTK